MITLTDKDLTLELTQSAADGNINVDILENDRVEYYFEIPAKALLKFISQYERDNNII